MLITHDFEMPQLGNRRRTIRVFLPRNYDGNHAFPVFYMHDGQNLFEAETAFSGYWHIMETMYKMPLKRQAIIVGIDNGGGDRLNEYAPFRKRSNGGEGAAYLRFVAETLKPFIDRTYQTLPQRETTGIAGSSLGGLISLFGGLAFGEIFGKVGVMSPAVWFNPEVGKMPEKGVEPKSQFYIVASKNESKYMEATLQNLYNAFKKGGFSDEQVRVTIRDRGQHNETFWAREFRKMIEWLL